MNLNPIPWLIKSGQKSKSELTPNWTEKRLEKAGMMHIKSKYNLNTNRSSWYLMNFGLICVTYSYIYEVKIDPF